MNAMKKIHKINKEELEDNSQFAYRINLLTKRAAMTLSKADEKTRDIWQESKSLDIFLSKIKSHERNIILSVNRTRKMLGQKDLNLYEAVKELAKQKEKKDMYKEDEQTNKSSNHVIRQTKIETKLDPETEQTKREIRRNWGQERQTEPRERLYKNTGVEDYTRPRERLYNPTRP